MGSRRAKSNRGRHFGRRCAKAVAQLEREDVRVIDPLRDRDECWRWLELVDDFPGFQVAGRSQHEIQSRIHHLGLV
jgi:hypothetical protein